jgi:hypothetical protein
VRECFRALKQFPSDRGIFSVAESNLKSEHGQECPRSALHDVLTRFPAEGYKSNKSPKLNESKPMECVMKMMRVAFLACLVCLVQTNTWAGSIESNLKKSFSVNPGGKLMVEVESGSVEISPGDVNDVIIDVLRKVTGADSVKAQEIFTGHEVTFDQDGQMVTVRSTLKENVRKLVNRGGVNLQVRFVISVPKRFDLDIHTGSGSISSGDLDGKAKAVSGGGDIRFRAISGPLDAQTASGSIKLESASGTVSAKSSGGDIALGQLAGPSVAETASGSIAVISAQQKLAVKSGGGDIRLGDMNGETGAQTSSGSIKVKSAKAKLTVKSNGGDIALGEVSDVTSAGTDSGSITVEAAKAQLAVRSGGGDLRLGVLEGDTTASTSSGSITVKSSKAKLTASSGGGDLSMGNLNGPATLDTSSGAIKVKSAHAPIEIKSNGGDIQVEDAADTVQAKTSSGSVSAGFSAQPGGDCRLMSSGGDIRVRLASMLAFDIDAEAGGGDVKTELPVVTTVVGERKSGPLKGKLNGGGKALLLKTSSGNVSIKKL